MELQKVILIDDDDSTNFYNSIILGEVNIAESQIIIFTNPIEAVNYLKEDISSDGSSDQFTAVFLDLNMPKMNGWELIEQLKLEGLEKPEFYHLGILTASLDESDQEKADNSKCVNSFIEKPLTEEKALKFLNKAN